MRTLEEIFYFSFRPDLPNGYVRLPSSLRLVLPGSKFERDVIIGKAITKGASYAQAAEEFSLSTTRIKQIALKLMKSVALVAYYTQQKIPYSAEDHPRMYCRRDVMHSPVKGEEKIYMFYPREVNAEDMQRHKEFVLINLELVRQLRQAEETILAEHRSKTATLPDSFTHQLRLYCHQRATSPQ